MTRLRARFLCPAVRSEPKCAIHSQGAFLGPLSDFPGFLGTLVYLSTFRALYGA